MAVLHHNYTTIQTNHPHIHSCLKAGTFAQEVAKLLMRYQDGTPMGSTGRNVKLTNHWATPGSVYVTWRRADLYKLEEKKWVKVPVEGNP
jgi:hypothetical protein